MYEFLVLFETLLRICFKTYFSKTWTLYVIEGGLG